MTPGEVVRIRINPSTCMSVLDVLEAVGMKVEDKSFAACVSSALNILVETAKQSGVLPEPDPYQFAYRMRHHRGDAAPDRRKLPSRPAGILNPLVFPQGHAPTLARKSTQVEVTAPNLTQDEQADLDIMLKLDGLATKRECVDMGLDGFVWTAEDQAEYEKLSAARTSSNIKGNTMAPQG